MFAGNVVGHPADADADEEECGPKIEGNEPGAFPLPKAEQPNDGDCSEEDGGGKHRTEIAINEPLIGIGVEERARRARRFRNEENRFVASRVVEPVVCSRQTRATMTAEEMKRRAATAAEVALERWT